MRLMLTVKCEQKYFDCCRDAQGHTEFATWVCDRSGSELFFCRSCDASSVTQLTVCREDMSWAGRVQ